MYRAFVPPYVLERIAASSAPRLTAAPAVADATLRHDAVLRAAARSAGPVPTVEDPGLTRTISDAEHTEQLPGVPVRREGEPPTGDSAADEAYDGFGATHALFAQVYGWDSLDNAGTPLNGTVHFGRNYDNAFWDGTRMVFGDGDGEVFRGFTGSLTVIAHELTHGITTHTADLVYRDQPGALNESISDVFGALVEQYRLGQRADEASWLIGAEVFTDEVQGVAMRSMRAPGTAYDDDVLGRDPQPAHMRDYVRTTGDNGGVHVNSGIPNRAFATTALELGGHAWERAGRIWFETLTGGGLGRTADFATFAARTVAVATKLYGAESAEVRAVRGGWETIGVPLQP
ncbi:M4 family metallopeptidase [Aldersonia sp. NBC_00410]|uniref:M4 family metallopeptidase n=1 Tax=Aldersonia sp. NBC_00410 TaxID=2975954 RepID=UPI00224CFF0E|nr:M4 family metallopeptidase [Aldersonia sp. NBC_00410]MCX5042933.1 M4 family metallopeptidase [Aldersonia sp. NBC_00410]